MYSADYIFFSICVIAALLGCYGAKTERGIFVAGAALLLGLLAGCRDCSVGTDSVYYYNMFDYIAQGYSGYFRSEPLFLAFAQACLLLWGDPQSVFLGTAIVTNALFVRRLWTMRNSLSFPWLFVMYIMLIYPQSLNVMRQWLALAIVFFATGFLTSHRGFRFVVMVIVAALVHNTAIISFSLLLIHYCCKTRSVTKALIVCIATAVTLVVAFVLVGKFAISRYSYFFSSRANAELSYMYLGKVALYVSYLYYARYRPKAGSRKLLDAGYVNGGGVAYLDIVYGFGLVLASVGMLYDQLGRIAAYLTVFEIAFIARVVSNNSLALFYRCSYSLIAFYNFFVGIALQGLYGISPYSFFF